MTARAAWSMVEAAPSRTLAGVRGFTGFYEQASREVRRLEASRSRVSIIVGVGEQISIGRIFCPASMHRAFLVGPGCGPLFWEHSGTFECVEVDLAPWAAAALFGRSDFLPSAEPVALSDVAGGSAVVLCDRLADAADWSSRFALVEQFLHQQPTNTGAIVGAEVAWAWEQLERSAGAASIGLLADEIGWSGRHFAERFREQVGVGPKLAAQRIRFEYARLLLDSSAGSLADAADAAGYSDQSHMTRAFSRFAGCTPSTYLSARFADLPGTSAAALGG